MRKHLTNSSLGLELEGQAWREDLLKAQCDSGLWVRKLKPRGQAELLTLTSHVADRVLVLRPSVRPEPLRWENQVQNSGPSETSRPFVISIGESSPRDICLNTKTQLHSMTSKLQCCTPHTKQLATQENNPIH